jgi:hypothetical protein
MAKDLPGNRRVSISDDRAERGEEGTFEVSITNFDSLTSVEVADGIESREMAEDIVENITEASEINQKRSERAISVDRSKQSDTFTTDVDRWSEKPAELDFLGIDSKEPGGFY